MAFILPFHSYSTTDSVSNDYLEISRSEIAGDFCILFYLYFQISVYNYTWGNYDCFTKSGYVCEIELPTAQDVAQQAQRKAAADARLIV